MDDLVPNLWLHLAESTAWSLSFAVLVGLINVRNSRVKCLLYRLCLLKFLLPSGLVLTWFDLGATVQTLPALQFVAQPVQTLSSTAAVHSYSLYFLSIWLLGAIGFLLARGLVATRFHQRLKNSKSAFDGREEDLLRTVLASIGKSKDYLRGFVFEGGPTIGLYGIFRPRIIARRAFLDSLNNEELRSVFQHEAEHRLRRDNLWRIAAEMTLCLFWFHPLVWRLKKHIDHEMEKACDEQVVSTGGNSNDYVKSLLKAAEFSPQEQFFGAIALSETSLKRRVQNIIEYQKEKLSKMKLFTLSAMALMLFGGALAFSEAVESSPDADAFGLHEVDVMPKKISMDKPTFPKTKYAEDIRLVWIVSKTGQVTHVKIDGEKPKSKELRDILIKMIKTSKWEPGLKDGKAVNVRIAMVAKSRPDKKHKKEHQKT